MEEKYNCATCQFCYKKRLYLAELPCKHSFCGTCCKKLVRVTKIYKAHGSIKESEQEGVEPLKCPHCNFVNMIGPEQRSSFDETLMCEEIRAKLCKQQEIKMHAYFSRRASAISEFDPFNFQLC